MESKTMYMPISELIMKTDSLMVKLGYKPSVMRHFRQVWNALKNHAIRRGETVLTTELGYTLLREHYQIEPYDSYLTNYKALVRRGIMLLLEYQVSGSIAKRMLKRDHTFPPGFAEIGDEYLQYLKTEKHLSDGTLRNHQLALEAAFTFFFTYGTCEIGNLDIPLVNAYLKTLAGCTKSYISGRVNILKRFLSFALKTGRTDIHFYFPEVSVYKDQKVARYYREDEIKQILDAVDRANPRGKRDYAMLLLGARYGLRISDIKGLELRNIDFVNNRIDITQIKTGKPLSLDLLPDVGWAIIDYIKNGRPQSESPKMFIRHVSPFISFSEADNVAYIITKYALAAGIKTKDSDRSSFHMLRFGLASALLQRNVSLTTISSILGHSTLNVTTTYTKIDIPQLLGCALEVPVK